MRHGNLKITKKGNSEKDNLIEPTVFKECKNQCGQGIIKTTEEVFSSQPYSTQDF